MTVSGVTSPVLAFFSLTGQAVRVSRQETLKTSPPLPRPMRIGVIGAGVMGRNHARGVGALGHELTGVVDSVPGVAEDVASVHRAAGFSTLANLLDARSDTEAVVIATPTATHERMALEAIEAGLHVLVEKPLAPEESAAKRMIAAAQDSGRTLAVGHIERHNPIIGFAKKALDEERFGRPITLSTRRVSSYPGRIRDVGCVLDIGIHDIDVLNHLAGATPESVFAIGGRHMKDAPVEDHASLLLRYPGSLTGAAEVNWLTPRKVRRLALTCDAAYVEADYIEQRVEISRSSYGSVDEGDLSRIPIETHVETITLQREEPLLRELSDFVDAITNSRPPLADGYVGLQALAVARAALESMATGRSVVPNVVEVHAS